MVNIIEGNLSASSYKFGIVVSRFNEFITKRLLDSAIDCLSRHGAPDKSIDVIYCPGAFEIPQVAQKFANTNNYDAIICLGCVIQGDTPHFDFIAGEAAKGVAQVSMQTGLPVIFGIITADTMEQAMERAGTKSGNKGRDAALNAIEMVNLLDII